MFTATQKIKELRGQGWGAKVRVRRINRAGAYLTRREIDPGDFRPRGGITEVELTAPGGEVFSGRSVCHPEKDNFNKKIGLEIALGRALKKAQGEES